MRNTPALENDVSDTPTPTQAAQVVHPDAASDIVVVTPEDLAAQAEVSADPGRTLEALTALEEIGSELRKSIVRKTVSIEQLQLTRVLVKQLCRVAGLPAQQYAPALESMAQDSTLTAEVALEGLAETAKKVWDHILEMIQKAIAWARDYFTRLNTYHLAAEKRIEILGQKVGTLSGKTPKQKDVGDSIPVSTAQIMGKPVDPVQALTRLADFISQAFGSDVNYAFEKALTNVGNKRPDKVAEGVISVAKYHLAEFTRGVSLTRNTAGLPDDVVQCSAPFLDNCVVTVDKDGLPGFHRTGPLENNPSDRPLPVLTPQQMKEIIEQCRVLAAGGANFMARVEIIGKGSEEMMSDIERLRRDAENGEEFNAMVSAVREMWKVRSVFVNNGFRVSQTSFHVVRNMLDYVEESIRRY